GVHRPPDFLPSLPTPALVLDLVLWDSLPTPKTPLLAPSRPRAAESVPRGGFPSSPPRHPARLNDAASIRPALRPEVRTELRNCDMSGSGSYVDGQRQRGSARIPTRGQIAIQPIVHADRARGRGFLRGSRLRGFALPGEPCRLFLHEAEQVLEV